MKIIIITIFFLFTTSLFAHSVSMSPIEGIIYIGYLYLQGLYLYFFKSIGGVLHIIASLVLAFNLPYIFKDKIKWFSNRNLLIRFIICLLLFLLVPQLILLPFLVYLSIKNIVWNNERNGSFITSNKRKILTVITIFVFFIYSLLFSLFSYKFQQNMITHMEMNVAELPHPGKIYPDEPQEMRYLVETSVVYLKSSNEVKNLQPINDVLTKIISNSDLCKKQGEKAMVCMCSEKTNHKKLSDMLQEVLTEHPEWKKVTIYNKDKKGVRTGRVPLGGVTLRLEHYNKYCKS